MIKCEKISERYDTLNTGPFFTFILIWARKSST